MSRGDGLRNGEVAPGISERWLAQHPYVGGLLEEWPPERVRQVLDAVLELWGCLDLTTAIDWRWNPRRALREQDAQQRGRRGYV